MAKFKVGDRVRFTEACNNEWRFGPHTKFKDGVIVKDNASGFRYTVKTDNGDGYVNESHIELVAKEPKFKVGDVVKYVDGRDGARCNKDGARGTITAVRDRSYHFNDGLISSDAAEKYGGDYELELVATAKAIPENTTKTTFKVGDKVKVVRSPYEAIADMWIRFDSESGVGIGDVGVISSMDGICACVDFDGQENFYMNCEQLELIEPTRFKVGDRVMHERWGAGVVARVDTVETTLPYRVDFSDSFYQWLPASKLTPENTTKTTETAKPVAECRFKIGDRVTRTNGVCATHGTIIAQSGTRYNTVNWDDGLGDSNSWQDYELRLILRQSQPAIVALIEHGQPKPSYRPYVHATTDAATKEAERLAGKYPGQKFGVYQLVTARIGTVSVAEV